MLKSILIGNVGGDAKVINKDGRSFATFRVAHNDSWKDAAGQEHSSVMWIDCILDSDSKVLPYIKAGIQVFVEGAVSLRVYSSEKDRCMKAGMTLKVQRIELLGGSSDVVPRRLFSAQGAIYDVTKYFRCDNAAGEVLRDSRGKEFAVDDNGWVVPMEQAQEQINAGGTANG